MKLVINIIIGVLVLGALYFSFNFLMSRKSEPAPSVQVVSAGSPSASHNDFLALLIAVRNVNLDSTIFDDPIFNRLENFRQPLPVRNQGREDPFSPVSGRAGKSATSTKIGR